MGTVNVFNPIGRVAAFGGDVHQIGERLGVLTGKTIGFIDAMKPNADRFLKEIEEILRSGHSLRETHTVRKNLTPNMAIAHELDPSVEGAIVAWGD